MHIILDDKTIEELVTMVTHQVLQQLPIVSEQQQNTNKANEKLGRYMNQKQVCEYLNVTPHTVNDYIKKGLPVVQISDGGRTYYDRQDVDDFMDNHKIST